MLVEKKITLRNDIIFLDGLWGTGKSILSPILSNMYNIEKIKVESIYEYISSMYFLDKIEMDAAIWMLHTYADTSQYNNRIGREINLRWSDDTGLKHVLNKWVYIKRLFGQEGDFKIDEINRENIALGIMSHMIMLTPQILIEAFNNRVKVIEMVRHPLYMIVHFANYLDRFEVSREFTMSYYYKDVKIPWFINQSLDEFVQGNKFERAVQCIVKLYSLLEVEIANSKKNGLQILDLSFEEIVFDTKLALKKIEFFLGRQHSEKIEIILKKQKLPRNTIAQGNGHKSYGWQSSNKSELDYYQDLLKIVNDNCSISSQESLQSTIKWYNNMYPSKLSNFSYNL
jgi:hypothetical protein